MERTTGFDANLPTPEHIFQSAFLYAPIGMAIVALDGQWHDANPSLCELVGYSKEELLQMTFQDITHPDDFLADLALVRQLYAGKIPSYKREKRYFHKLGHIIWVSLSVSLTRDDSGHPLHFIVQIVDITEDKKIENTLQQSEERYRTLFNSIDEGFCIIEILFDEQNKPIDLLFLEMNPLFKKYTQLDRISVGKTIMQLYPDTEIEWIDTYGRVALTGESVRFEKEFKSINHWFDIYAFRFGNPDSHKVAVVFNDITQRKIAGFELEQMRHNLDERINELETALAEVKTIQDVIPICSYCKSIRSENNLWEPLEGYLLHRLNVLCSHSICPKCYAKAITELDSFE